MGSPRTIKLVEAFRTILRAVHPGRPALADEIESYAWLYFDRNRRSVDPEIWAYVDGEEFWRGEERAGEGREDEVKAFKDAHRRLAEFVRQEHGKFRLRGVLDPRKPLDDIDPADAKVGEIDVFAEELRVFLNGKVARTYRQVHCYETDVRHCVTELRSKTSKTKPNDVPLPKPLRKFTKNYKGRRVLKDFTAAAQADGINTTREKLIAALNTLGPRRRGAPTGPRLRAPQPKSAGN
jgi:hypothetical protein